MNQLRDFLEGSDLAGLSKEALVSQITKIATDAGYTVEEVNKIKPWGAYIRFSSADAERFVSEFFPSINFNYACLGREDVELSPKILLVAPSQRLSWQYHFRRAERWKFLTRGAFCKNETDNQGEVSYAQPGDEVQVQPEERHRLIGLSSGYVLVAEIWQHTDPTRFSDEGDIIRLSDDYHR